MSLYVRLKESYAQKVTTLGERIRIGLDEVKLTLKKDEWVKIESKTRNLIRLEKDNYVEFTDKEPEEDFRDLAKEIEVEKKKKAETEKKKKKS